MADIARVLERKLDMDSDDAEATAQTLHDLFQGKLVIEDTEVESKERAFLWSMMLQGVITMETQERPHPEHGRRWRYFYWHIVPPERLLREEKAEEPEERSVYDKLPADAWSRPSMAAT